jgi:hypothetical protein
MTPRPHWNDALANVRDALDKATMALGLDHNDIMKLLNMRHDIEAMMRWIPVREEQALLQSVPDVIEADHIALVVDHRGRVVKAELHPTIPSGWEEIEAGHEVEIFEDVDEPSPETREQMALAFRAAVDAANELPATPPIVFVDRQHALDAIMRAVFDPSVGEREFADVLDAFNRHINSL